MLSAGHTSADLGKIRKQLRKRGSYGQRTGGYLRENLENVSEFRAQQGDQLPVYVPRKLEIGSTMKPSVLL